MKATELRLGNYVMNLEREIDRITGISDPVITTEKIPGDIDVWVDPIPLTEEWFLKFGFEKKKNDAWFRKKLPKTTLSPNDSESILSYCNGIIIWRQYDEQGFSITEAADVIRKTNAEDASFNLKYNSIVLEKRIKYVHQLQNLYFALTGEEIENKINLILEIRN